MLMVKQQPMLYQEVYNDLRRKIQSGELPVGCRISPENELTRHYETSTSTIRKAVQLLCDEGLLCKRRPVGTFVIGCPQDKAAPAESVNFPDLPVAPAQTALKVAVLIPDVSVVLPEGDYRHWQLYLRRLKGIFAAAARHNVTVLMHDLGDQCGYEEFDGLIIIRWAELFEPEPFRSIARQLAGNRIPYVVISDYYFELTAKWWLVDNLELEFFNAYRFLAENRMKSLLYVGPCFLKGNPTLQALTRAAELYHFDYELLNIEDALRKHANARIQQYCAGDIAKLRKFDTIFCSTDWQAFGVMEFLLENNIRIPDDLNLMGCDNLAEAATCPVPLTTFEFSGTYAGELAMELMLKAIANPNANGEMIAGRGEILIRNSVKLYQ